jgi:hypothetical protein
MEAVRDLTGHANSRMQTAATWLFILPLFVGGVARDAAKVQTAGLALLAFTSVVILRRPLPKLAISRIYLTAAVLILILCAYLTFRSWPSYFGTSRSYDIQAMIFVATYVAVAVFAVMFFEERLFERVVWRAATLTLWVGVSSCIISRLTHHLLLINPSSGLRMQGTLSEPSAWAPVLPLVVLLGIRRRSWLYVMLALLGTLLTNSPTCILVLLVTVPVYYVLCNTGRHRMLLLFASVVVILVGIGFLQTANPDHYLNSRNTAEVAIGRLLSGIRNVETDGQVGSNDRFTSTTVVIAEARTNGWMRAGAGPAADNTYFPAKYPVEISDAYRPNNLWVSILFDFGEGGLVVLGAMMLWAVWRMRHRPDIAALLLPFFIASLINSAEGSFEYAFVALGVMLLAFGWVQPIARPPFPGANLEQCTPVDSNIGGGVSKAASSMVEPLFKTY